MEIKTNLMEREANLRAALDRAGIQVAILSHYKHVFYFSGTMPGLSPVLLVLLPQKTIAVAPAQVGNYETITYTDYNIHQVWDVYNNLAAALEQALSSVNVGSVVIGLDTNYCSAALLPVIHQFSSKSSDIGPILWEIQKIKDKNEVERIQTNVAVIDKTFETIRQVLKPGMKELELWGIIYQTMSTLNGQAVHLEGDLGGGIRGVDLAAQPTNEVLQAGEAVFIDIYTSMHGYYADFTRVFVLSEPSPKHLEIHGILEEALAAGEKALRSGVHACEIDQIVRAVVASYGYGEYFTHHTGHNYGLFQQERPFLIPAETLPLEAGMIVAIEPGIYIPNWGGMRLEGNYLIETGGARRLDQYPSKLTVCG